MYYVDEGLKDVLVVLLIYGMLIWLFFYWDMIFGFVDVGYCCIVLDYMGFGCFDKLIDIYWYMIVRYIEIFLLLIVDLDF